MSYSLLSPEEKRAHVLAYLACGYGRKAGYLREHGITDSQLHKWRRQLFAGTLELNVVPRGGSRGSVEDNWEIVRLQKAVDSLSQQLRQQAESHFDEVADKDAKIAQSEQAVEALGKAIALLHASSESAADTTED